MLEGVVAPELDAATTHVRAARAKKESETHARAEEDDMPLPLFPVLGPGGRAFSPNSSAL